ncbi:MAG: LptF/LptG family permease [Spirochaetes bacterium]|nr:LptF/LptG family permease [Spirochaetota bacterium]
MKLFTKYTITELIGPFLIGLGFFTFVFVLNPILRLVDMLVVKRVPFNEILLLFIFLLPSTVAIVLPMAVLVAVLMAYGRLSSDSEIIAMRASGISYLRIFYPAILLSIIISIVGIVFNDTLLPNGNYAFQKLYKEIVQRKPLTQIDEHTLTEISTEKIIRSIGIDRIDKKNDIMHGIVIHERSRDYSSIKTIMAKNGRWLKSIEEKNEGKIILIMRLLLEDGNIQQPTSGNLDEFSNIPFRKLIVNIPQEIAYSINVTKGAREKSTAEIMKDIKVQTTEKNKPSSLWVEYHKRYSIPFAALAFVLIGLPFSIVSGRSGKSVSLGISVIIIFLYYLFYIFGESMGKQGTLDAVIALWLPNLVFMAGGAFYIYKISQT